jgi:hypothetical protein
MDGGKYKCVPENNFKNICVEEQDGKYRTKDSCVNDCENVFIKKRLIDSKLNNETGKFYGFIKKIIKEEKIDVYIKGGNVIGLFILKMIYNKYKNDDKKFKEKFDDFLKLELIKDWDFSAYTKKEISDSYHEKLDGIAKEFKLVPRAKTFILYQTKKPLLTDDKPLFEISVLEKDRFCDMEIPFTTMKVAVNEYNMKYIFMFAQSFLTHSKGSDFDLDIIKRMISKMFIIIHPCKKGFYDNFAKLDVGDLNSDLVDFIKKYEKNDKNLPQFLITHIEDPFRILYRLPEKNIKKSRKVKEFLDKNNLSQNTDWIIDANFVIEIIEQFTKDLGKKIVEIYKKSGIEKVDDFLNGIYWTRTEIEYKKLFTDYGKNLLDNILGELLKLMKEEQIKKLDGENKFYHLLKYLQEQKDK